MDKKIVKAMNSVLIMVVFVVLYRISLENYLLFHSIAEIFSICIAISIFVITWNAIQFIENNFLILIGIAYLFIGSLDLLHTLSYKGMNIFTDYDYYANQFWIATRFLESITILMSFVILKHKRKINTYKIFIIYLIVTVVIVASILYWDIFPICFVEGVGLTTFKVVSEYIICSILLVSLVVSYYCKEYFDKSLYRQIVFSIIFTILSELAFTFYVSNYGISNMLGHFFKIISFYLIYKAIVAKGISEPHNTIFKELQGQVNTDGLTGLLNHRCLYDNLEAEIDRTYRTKIAFSIILFDIDHFKNINDQFGHTIGDEALASISSTIKNMTRSTDIVGRYGGEEFMVILPSTDLKTCYFVSEKIRKEIEVTKYCKENINITVSAGIAQFDKAYVKESLQNKIAHANELVQEADSNLYKAKQSGRNRTIGID